MTNQEYNLTIMDIDWEDGQEYMIQIGHKDPFRVVVSEGDLSFEIDAISYSYVQDIATRYTLKEIALASFERCIDYWSKVPVDTKVLVRDSEDSRWKKRHFAKYEDGRVCTWGSGSTSWTDDNTITLSYWKYAKLATEEE